ncbi:MAG: ParA family protein [Ramlibacter sp.]|nr:ParA family protein [Ramlibacter sp.]
MPVIAIVNRKGGSGKSTLAAHIAAWCARQGNAVMLGDVDRQQSSRTWLRRRDPALPAIAPWALDQKNTLRVPTGITHVVLDTPGGLHGFELARVVMFADAILMPVCHSVFDRESAAACHAELMALPRVASGRCRLATVGMRIDGRTHAAETLRQWSEGLKLPFLGALRETQMYVRCLERGLTIFDLSPSQAATDLAQWQPLIEWMTPLLNPVQAANDPTPTTRAVTPPTRLGSSRPESLMPAQESLIHGGRLSAYAATTRPASVPVQPLHKPSLPRAVNPGEVTQIPQFLKRGA